MYTILLLLFFISLLLAQVNRNFLWQHSGTVYKTQTNKQPNKWPLKVSLKVDLFLFYMLWVTFASINIGSVLATESPTGFLPCSIYNKQDKSQPHMFRCWNASNYRWGSVVNPSCFVYLPHGCLHGWSDTAKRGPFEGAMLCLHECVWVCMWLSVCPLCQHWMYSKQNMTPRPHCVGWGGLTVWKDMRDPQRVKDLGENIPEDT